MASIELRDLSHTYGHGGRMKKLKAAIVGGGNEFAISGLNIRWEDGSANALLGPSGCGKTTLLNIISGLIRPTGGQVLFGGEEVTDLNPEQRRIAQVFQFPVVYDSLDVYGNLAFPLRNDKVPEPEVRRRVQEIAETLEINDIMKSPVNGLTPAEKQKIALGRGLVRPNPAAVLLDEPLTVIDPKQQWGLRRKLRQVQRQLKITMIYVTHDQHEALTFADNVTVMSQGAVTQTGTPHELHSEPASPFVGYFIGSPGMNVLQASLKGGFLDLGGYSVEISRGLFDRLSKRGEAFEVGIRPELVEVSTAARDDQPRFGVLTVENAGAYKVLTLDREGQRIKARVSETTQVAEGQTVWVRFPEEHLKIFKDGGRVDR